MEIYNIIDVETLMRKGFTGEVMRSPEPPKKWDIPKKNGGVRTIYHPSSKMKLIQYWLINRVLTNLPVHDAAYAFIKDRSIKHNALRHATTKNKYYVKIDLKDFFPSIKYNDFEHAFKTYRDRIDFPNNLDTEVLFLIKGACFIPDLSLPIGFPTSPIIANFVAREFDEKLTVKLNSIDRLNATYTRYADDIIISTGKKGCSKQIINAVKSTLKDIKPNFKINLKKVKICSASGGSIIVTGLKVCNDFHITLHKKTKDKVRLLLSLLAKDKLKIEDYNKLSGYIAYTKSIDPHFYTKLNRRYFKEIKMLENHHNKSE
ncbi:RNA-directed DNA polymerase [Hafnia paralvei]|jgi:RNA-directed DNA polymerase|uniref:retron St85 family RNA-directed DNA polymerase n=1 Tax=Hafnia paralvei TaxID=546367 RepID=UPI0010347158|nr:retron St85 family RNA-directed DNA polymerase [Hafnia paralvei]TBM18442.1 RNA-directed DNA polymerase [Hafnia paralvei]TBM26852.1 RNA-directed DNA polymerase [Hafnia paralvei]